jgi:acyl-homoserine lactone acylase PvdQ
VANFVDAAMADQIPDPQKKLSIILGFVYTEYFAKLLDQILENPYHDTPFCPKSNSKMPCVDLIANSLEKTLDLLTNVYGKDMNQWIWGDMVLFTYPHIPFSMSPLKPFFHREVKGQGT